MRTQCESYLPSINLEVDNSEVTQKLQEFHITLATLANVECNVCLERFPSVKTDVSGACSRCRGDSEEVKMYSAANSMDPGAVPHELSVSHI